jgi:hypothetical protein
MLDSLANAFALEGIAIYWGIGLLFFAAEYWWPTRPVPYLQVFLPDVAALTTYQIFFVFAGDELNSVSSLLLLALAGTPIRFQAGDVPIGPR